MPHVPARFIASALAVSCSTLLGSHGCAAASSALRPNGSILWIVENCNDAGPGSLRYAAQHANHGDGIDLSSLSCSTISVTSGAINLRDVELMGPGADQLTIEGTDNQFKRIFNHNGNGGTLTIHDVTIRGAKYQSNAGQGGGCLRSVGANLDIRDAVFDTCIAFAPSGSNVSVRGGAIAAYGNDVHLARVTLSNNQASTAAGVALGGALYVGGDKLLLARSTISNNAATSSDPSAVVLGGGVFAHGEAMIAGSTIDGNVSEGRGGGAVIEGHGSLMFSTVSNNASVGGGSGIAFLGTRGLNDSAAYIFASTISGNEAQASTISDNGALYVNTAFTSILASTIAGNVEYNTPGVGFGAGILFGPSAWTSSSPTMVSTIVHGNHIRDSTHGADIAGPLGSHVIGDHNLVGLSYVYLPADTIRSSDPLLGPLQDNGGPTWTHMPAANSPVVDHGNAQGQVFDQREYPRVSGVAADIGAVEVQRDVIFTDGFD